MPVCTRKLVAAAFFASSSSFFAGFASATPLADASAIHNAVSAQVERVQGYSYNNGPWYGPGPGYGLSYPAPYYASPAPLYVTPGPLWYGPHSHYRRAVRGRPAVAIRHQGSYR
jgi:hypothetical protein